MIEICVTNIQHALSFSFFFFNDTATTEIYTLSLHDALPICFDRHSRDDLADDVEREVVQFLEAHAAFAQDRKSTRLNSSHSQISYAVFCLKKKEKLSHSSSLSDPYSIHK